MRVRSRNRRGHTRPRGSIAYDEYLQEIKQARVNEKAVAIWVETCFCDPFPTHLPARERNGTVGLLRLRPDGWKRRSASKASRFWRD